MEYIQKILYSLLIYLIPGLFFIFGLLLAYLLWYRHSRRLNVLVIENQELQHDISSVNTEDLRNRFHGKVEEKVQSVNNAWHHSHSNNEQHLKESLKQLEAQKIQLVTAKTELEFKAQQLKDVDKSFTNYKQDQEAIYKELDEKNSLLTSKAESIAESPDYTEVLASQKAKIKALEAQLAGVKSTDNLNSGSSQTVTLSDHFANTQARNHYRYGYIFDDNRQGYTDQLSNITGLSDELEEKLNRLGIYQLKQIALWNHHQVAAFQHDLDFSGNIHTEEWISQAAKLHNEKHGGVIKPISNLSSNDQKPSSISQSVLLKSFVGEDVRADDVLGVVYNSRPNEIDDLKLIRGVAADLEEMLQEAGIYRFRQIANWDVKHMTEFSNRLLDSPGRIERDDWKIQAKRFHLAKYGEVIG